MLLNSTNWKSLFSFLLNISYCLVTWNKKARLGETWFIGKYQIMKECVGMKEFQGKGLRDREGRENNNKKKE